MRLLVAFIAICVLASAQVTAPRAGLVRLDDGTVRPVYGVAGSFTLGQPLLRGIEALSFNGAGGCARTGDEILIIGRDGEVLRRLPLAEDRRESESVAFLENDELVLRASGKRLRLPFSIYRLERAGAEYVALSGPEGRLLARITDGREALFAMPEAAE